MYFGVSIIVLANICWRIQTLMIGMLIAFLVVVFIIVVIVVVILNESCFL